MGSNKDVEEKVQELKKKYQDDADRIIKVKFPKKILELSEMIDSNELINFESSSPAVDILSQYPVPETPKESTDLCRGQHCSDQCVFLFPKGTIESNKKITDLVDKLKPLLLDLIQDTIKLSVGIGLLVPKVEDGNNFGVEIQEAALEEVNQVQAKSRVRFDEILNYFEVRGNLIKKCIRHPHCKDYQAALKQYDENMRFKLIMMFISLRSSYILLHDFFVKNLSKITKPRGASNMESMY
ncbi:Proteasome activator complex subunit 3 [Halotydeus destructor]|nr:Proteasome activator complex subunit 3 [Halotydeus destructor]